MIITDFQSNTYTYVVYWCFWEQTGIEDGWKCLSGEAAKDRGVKKFNKYPQSLLTW